MIRFFALICLFCVQACVTQDVAAISQRARFPEYPTTLFDAVEAVCTEPADVFRKPDRNTVECRSYLSPDATAAVLVIYDGTLDDLPQMVLRFEAEPQLPDYVVEFGAFLNVPRKEGPAVRVVHRDAAVNRRMQQVMRSAGGTPEDS